VVGAILTGIKKELTFILEIADGELEGTDVVWAVVTVFWYVTWVRLSDRLVTT
jgi:hypothetical protein